MSDQRAELEQRLSSLGINLNETAFEEAYARIQEIAGRSGAISEGQLRSIVDEAVSGMEVLDEVAASYQ